MIQKIYVLVTLQMLLQFIGVLLTQLAVSGIEKVILFSVCVCVWWWGFTWTQVLLGLILPRMHRVWGRWR